MVNCKRWRLCWHVGIESGSFVWSAVLVVTQHAFLPPFNASSRVKLNLSSDAMVRSLQSTRTQDAFWDCVQSSKQYLSTPSFLYQCLAAVRSCTLTEQPDSCNQTNCFHRHESSRSPYISTDSAAVICYQAPSCMVGQLDSWGALHLNQSSCDWAGQERLVSCLGLTKDDGSLLPYQALCEIKQ